MVEDTNPDVRYNAATRLAHLGDAAAISVLVEMLDPEEHGRRSTIEEQEDMRPFKRSVITLNALRAAGQLADKNSTPILARSRPPSKN